MSNEDLLKQAVGLLAYWIYLVDTNGTGWDDWAAEYKNAAYRVGGTLGMMINKEVAELKEKFKDE